MDTKTIYNWTHRDDLPTGDAQGMIADYLAIPLHVLRDIAARRIQIPSDFRDRMKWHKRRTAISRTPHENHVATFDPRPAIPSGTRGTGKPAMAVPLYAMGAPAGSPDFREAVRDGTEDVEAGPPGRFVLAVDGDSMEPSYPNHAKVIFDPRHKIETGRNYLVTLTDDRITFKRVMIDPKLPTKVILKPLNPRYAVRVIDQNDIAAVALAGRILEMPSEPENQ